ncbi:unnamed protein product [marine sediment metagenome]|uniref:Uncharacterized protein n=1 Tax=marine sediment metagenome TaxID=412755 RepID=X1H469_9ZZZZ
MEDFPADEEFTDEKISAMVAKVQSKGVRKRAMAERSASAPATRSEDLAVEAQEIDEADIREAVRQLKSKSRR